MTAAELTRPDPSPVNARRRVGLTFDRKEDYLAAGFAPADVMEFDAEDTIAALEGTIRELGHEVVRIGRGVELARRLVAGERWDLVFNFAEGVSGRSREAQVPALCELFDQPYTFGDPLTCAVTLDKGIAKRIVRDSGLATAAFAVVADADAARRAAVRQADRRRQLEGRNSALART
jgi:D-alanine-D-alanine ligase